MKTSPQIKKPHGGTRKNAGRKARDPDGTHVVSLRMTGEEKATFDMIGGTAWLRANLQHLAGSTTDNTP